MLIVGELINTSRKGIGQAVSNRDKELIQDLARRQVEAGVTHVDVNAGTLVKKEPDALRWLVEVVQEVVDAPLCIDSPNPVAIEAALKVHRGKAVVNSITAERDRFERIVPLVKEYGSSVVALCMGEKEMPHTSAERVGIADELVTRLEEYGIARDNIYFDPLVQPVSTSPENGLVVLETIKEIMRKYPGVHSICGLSNISFGLPNRKLLNRTFLVMAMDRGLDGVILDPLDDYIMSALRGAKALLNKDEYCLDYITAYREGKLV